MGLNGISCFFYKTFSFCCSDFSYTIRHRREDSHHIMACWSSLAVSFYRRNGTVSVFIYLLLSLGVLVWGKLAPCKSFRLDKITHNSLASTRSVFSAVNGECFGGSITSVVWCSLFLCVLWVKTIPLVCLKAVVNDELSIDRVVYSSLAGEQLFLSTAILELKKIFLNFLKGL